MRIASILALVSVLAVTFAASSANAYQSYATATGKPCSYCHVNPAGGGTRTPDGNYYKTYGVLPPAPTVTSIAASSGPNMGATSITNLAGTTFLTGATVKLRRTGYPDITATSVVVVSATKITCVFDLTGKKLGLWDVCVTNSDALAGTLPSGFGVDMMGSMPIIGTNIRQMRYSLMATACASYRMRLFGKVQLIDASTFWVDDGSGAMVKVFAPGYSGLVNGSFVCVTGGVDVSSTPIALVCSPAQIMKLR